MKYPDLGQIEKLVAEKLVSKRPHPTLPLFIYNYTAAAQGLGISGWSDALCDCRGLILDDAGEIVAKPFKKFWNASQVLDKIPAELPILIQEKMDGSLGVVANWQQNRVVATRGSFESEQASWFSRWLPSDFLPTTEETWLFEIIFKSNRIVVDYGDWEGGVLLAILQNNNGSDFARDHINRANSWRFCRPKIYGILPEWATQNRAEGSLLAVQAGHEETMRSSVLARTESGTSSTAARLGEEESRTRERLFPRPLSRKEGHGERAERGSLPRLQSGVSSMRDGLRSPSRGEETIRDRAAYWGKDLGADLCGDPEVRPGLRELSQDTDVGQQAPDPASGTTEGLVLLYANGLRVKIKLEEYCRLHRLITQCSTRTIWELLRSGKETAELIERVPAEFGDWVKTQIRELTERHNGLLDWAHGKFQAAPQGVSRKEFAEYAKQQDEPSLLFALLDAKPIEDMCWKLCEPKWATPFRGEVE